MLPLLLIDFKEIKFWFTTNTLAKRLIFLFFSLFLAVVFLGIFWYSFSFFKNLTFYQNFGFLTAKYIINVAIVSILWIGILTAFFSYYSFLLKSSQSLDYLFSLPIKKTTIADYFLIKTILSNFFFLLILFSPIVLAFGLNFGQTSILIWVIKAIVVAFILSVFANLLSVVAANFIFPYLKNREWYGSIFALLLFLFSMIGFFRLIFPKKIFDWQNLDSSFVTIYPKLPLNYNFLPNQWLTDMITSFDKLDLSSPPIFYLIVFFLGTVFLALKIYHKNFFLLYLKLKTEKKIVKPASRLFFLIDAFLAKELFSVIRVPAQIGYGIFLTFLAGIFYLSFSSILKSDFSFRGFTISLALFCYLWFLFFSIAYFLRLVFVLMAVEGRMGWYLFSLPIKKETILQKKLIFALILTLPLIIGGFLVWLILPFPKQWFIFLAFLTSITLIILAKAQTFLGAIFPNFAQGEDPEKISTSGMGVFALFFSSIIAAHSTLALYNYLAHQDFFSTLYFIFFGLLSTSLISLLAKEAVKKYQF